MDPPHSPPPSTIATTAETTLSDQLPPVPTTTPKLRLMCSYGGHIVPRPNDKSLFYAGGETRIVAIDRSTTAASLSSLTAHLSRTLFNNRPFHFKCQLPNEDLDSLISVTTDEDLFIMLEEHDRVFSTPSPKPSRIRLFLFPIKPESIGSALLDPKAESWFSDALKGTGVVQRGQSADAGLVNGLMGLDLTSGRVEAQVEECGNNVVKHGLEIGGGGGALPESLVLETSSSFGSTSSSVSMSNLPPIGVQSEEADKKVRVSSSASLESENSVGSAGFQAKPAAFQESRNHVTSGATLFTIESESPVSDPSSVVQMQKAVQFSGYQLPQQSDRKQHQHEVQYIHGAAHYVPQYSAGPLPQAPYYPVYQIPMHQQQHIPYSVNQPYPVYLVPVRPAQSYSMSMHSDMNNNPTMASSRPPPHPQTTTIIPPMVYKEIMTAQPTLESVAKVHGVVPAATPLVSVPSTQGQQQFTGPPEPAHLSQPATAAAVDVANYTSELDDNLAYTQIYKTQPSAPLLSSQYQVTTKAAAVLVSESTMHTNVKHQASSHPQ